MQSMALKINRLLENLEEDVESIVKSLTGIIPDHGKTLEEYRMDGIITRNPSDYKKAEIKVYSPDDFLRLW